MKVTTGESYLKPLSNVPAPISTATAALEMRPTPTGVVHASEESEYHWMREQSCESGFILTAGFNESGDAMGGPKFIPYKESTAPPKGGPFELDVPVTTGES
jgi:hypothetical protein